MNHHPTPEISIILPAYNEGPRLCQTLAAIRDTVALRYEVIVVNDGSTDLGCETLRADPSPFGNVLLIDLPGRHGVAHARNLGAARAAAPVLIAMDAHCIPQARWIEQLLEELEKPETGIVAPQIVSIDSPSARAFGLTITNREFGVQWLHRQGVEPYPIPAAGCACMAMKKEFFEEIGQFDEMRSYGMEDVELCLRCWLSGYSVTMVPNAEVGHWFKKEPFAVGWHEYLYNRLRTAVLHFDGDHLEGILHQLRTKPAFTDAMTSLLLSDIWQRRCQIRSRRRHDGAWFCEKFKIAL